MILPIIAYGDPVLRKVCSNIDQQYEGLETLISNMWETMYNANGVGLAAPQIGLPIRLFMVDTSPFAEDEDLTKEEQEQLAGFKKVFINAQIVEETGKTWPFNEGCLSIPDIREDVSRKDTINIEYMMNISKCIRILTTDFWQGSYNMNTTILKVFFLPIRFPA